MQITLIRHGETPWNVNGRWQGHAAIGLNDTGHLQAVHTAAFYRQEVNAGRIRIGAVYSSDALRARQTVTPILEVLNLPVTLDERLREIDLGEWQGLSREEIMLYDAERYAQMQADPNNTVHPSGESWMMVRARTEAALREIVAEHPHLTDEETILVMSHGGTIRHALRALKIDDTRIPFIENCSRTTITYSASNHQFVLIEGNDKRHLAGIVPHDARKEPEPSPRG